MGEMAVMDRSGDSKHLWDPGNYKEVEAMRELFDSLKKKGYLAYRVDKTDGTKDEVMKTFDPEAGSVIMIPLVAGG